MTPPPHPAEDPGAPALRRRLLRGNLVHNLIVAAGWLGAVPVALFVPVALAPTAATAWLFSSPALAAAILGGATLADAALLWALPRLGRSFGPVQGPLAVFTLGRHALSVPLAALPVGWALPALAALHAALFGLSLWGHLVAPFRVSVERVRLPVLPRDVTPALRLVFLSDLHMERMTARERWVQREVDRLAPDLVLFGGDVLNLSYVEDPRAQADAVRFFEALAAAHPLVAVLGNPTVEDRQYVLPLWRAVGVAPLRSEVRRVSVRGVELAIFGVSTTWDPDDDAERLRRLVEETPLPADTVRLLLYHMPDLVDRVAGFHVYLCGHTHGGQIRLPLLGPLLTATRAPRRYAAGTHRVGETWVHTGRGLGLEGMGAPRVRFWCPPELTLLELTGPR